MTEREEYFFIKGTRHGLMVARELETEGKISGAIAEVTKLLNKYRNELNVEDETDQLLEV